jgi:hypothetical protein
MMNFGVPCFFVLDPGKWNLSVSKAPEPSNVLWENLQYRGLNTMIRQAIVMIITVALLSSSLGIGVIVQNAQTSLAGASGSYMCLTGPQAEDPDAKQKIMWTKYSSYNDANFKGYLRCYCSPEFFNMNNVEYEFCAPWRQNQTYSILMTFTALAIVAGGNPFFCMLFLILEAVCAPLRQFIMVSSFDRFILYFFTVNAGLEVVLKELSAFQKPHSMSAMETTIALYVFIAQFINTGILVLVYNLKQDGIESVLFREWNVFWLRMNLPSLGVTFLHLYIVHSLFKKCLTLLFWFSIGEYTDTTDKWYATVGDKIFKQCITQSISPNAVRMHPPCNTNQKLVVISVGTFSINRGSIQACKCGT